MRKAPLDLNQGVYVSWDGFHIVLSVREPKNKVVFLEPKMFERMVEYYAEIDTFNFSNPFPARFKKNMEGLRKKLASAGEDLQSSPPL